MSHQSAKLYYGSSAEEMDFSLPYPAFLLEPGYSLPLGTTGSSVFISPALAHGTESSWEAGVLLCAEDEQWQCCAGELIQRPGQYFVLHAEARETGAHICSVCCEVHQWIPWGLEIQTRAQWTFLEHCCQATAAHGGLTSRG